MFVTLAMIGPNDATPVSSLMVWFGAVPPTTLSPVAFALYCIAVSASADQPRYVAAFSSWETEP